MKKLYFLAITFIFYSSYAQVTNVGIGGTLGGVYLNEIHYDNNGADTGEFIEISWTPNTMLDGLVVVLFNGSGDASYDAFDLDGLSTDANGFFVIGNSGVSGVDLVQPSNFFDDP